MSDTHNVAYTCKIQESFPLLLNDSICVEYSQAMYPCARKFGE